MRRSSRLRSALLVAAALVSIATGFEAAGARTESNSALVAARSEIDDEAIFVTKINALRSDLGLQPLVVHPALVPLARDWASQLRSQGSLSHTPDLSTGITADWSRLGENVGVAPAGQIDALFNAFVASPSHYENLIKPDYRHVGIGVVYGTDGRIWTSHRFMALASDGPTPAPTTPAPTTPAPTTPAEIVPPSTSISVPVPTTVVDDLVIVDTPPTPPVTPVATPPIRPGADPQVVAGVLRQLDDLGI